MSVAVAVLVGVGLSLFPPTGDDLHMSWPWRRWLAWGESPDWSGVRDFYVWFFNNENRRLANFLMIALSALPRWVGGMLSGIVVGYIVYKGARLAGLSKRPVAMSCWTAAVIIGLPWYDQFYLTDYQLNYTWPSAIMLALTDRLLNKNIPGGRHVIAMFLLALLLGVWHEGFGVPCMLAAITVAVLFRQYRKLSTWATVAGLAAGSAYLMLTPMMAETFSQAGGPGAHYFSGHLIRVVYPFLAVGVVYSVALATIYFVKKQNLLKQSLWVFATVVVASSWTITYVTATGPRAFTPGLVFGWLGIVSCAVILARHPARRRLAPVLAASLIYAFLAVHLVCADIVCAELSREYRQTIEAWHRDSGATAFVPMTRRSDVSWLCILKPHYNLFSHHGPVKQICRYYFDTDVPLLAVPEQLAGYTPEKAVKIPGDARATAYDCLIVCPWLGPKAMVLGMRDCYGWGEIVRYYYYLPFRSRADHRLYGWLFPERSDIDVTLHSIPDYLYTVDFTIEDWQLREIEAESGHLTR